jgi:hypothetical protein
MVGVVPLVCCDNAEFGVGRQLKRQCTGLWFSTIITCRVESQNRQHSPTRQSTPNSCLEEGRPRYAWFEWWWLLKYKCSIPAVRTDSISQLETDSGPQLSSPCYCNQVRETLPGLCHKANNASLLQLSRSGRRLGPALQPSASLLPGY